METSPFMPGLRNPSLLSSEIITGNIVTLCCTTACGSIFSTIPWNGRSGYASTVTRAGWPARTFPISVSFTNARTRTLVRSAICSKVVPPDTEPVADAITCPSDTGLAMIVPLTGATTVASSSRCLAKSRFVVARTIAPCAWVSVNCALSYSGVVITPVLNISSARFFAACATSMLAWALRKSALA